ncbi:MAG: HNH endonuclease signature motif containing protein, partial [Acidimicrobiaceae bacterium]|nr:HNH endonuclease signature motif containing protein [Acidimicrobiaceae bacterium]
KALKAIYGGCFACGADFDLTQAHHVEPVSQGGPTDIDNLVPACWHCHNKIHHFGWQIHGPPGKRTLHPPGAINHGPAHAPDPPVSDVSPAGRHCPARAPDPPASGIYPPDTPSLAKGGRLFALT